MGSNIVDENPHAQYYVGPANNGTQNYNATLRLIWALNHAVQFWANKAEENRDAEDHNRLMVLVALYSIVDNLGNHVEAISKILGETKGLLSNVYLPKAMTKMNQTTVNYGEQKFVLSARFTAKMTDEDKGFEWLKSINEFGAVKFQIHRATFNSLVKRKIEEDLITPPDHINVKTQDYVAIRKA